MYEGRVRGCEYLLRDAHSFKDEAKRISPTSPDATYADLVAKIESMIEPGRARPRSRLA